MKRFLLILILTAAAQAGHAYVPETGKGVRPEMNILATETRDGYDCSYMEFSTEKKERIKAYLLVPHQASPTNPMPAVLMLHDHGARFDIGKEKLVRPMEDILPDGAEDHIMKSSRQWVDKNFDGIYFADALAKEGYVVMVADALYWGERSSKDAQIWSELTYSPHPQKTDKNFIKSLKTRIYEGQREVYDSLQRNNVIWAEKMLRDDIASARLLQSLPYVDRDNIGAFGFSMGAHRCWMLAAFCEGIRCGVALSWMTVLDRDAEMSASDYSMAVMPMRAEMDFGDIGRFLSPKPMMFLSGTTDHLFPKAKVEEAYEKLRSHYHNAPHNLQTLFFEGGHHCGTDVQKTIIGYFDNQIGSMYKNPVIYADYSDPDICRVGDDYYMTSSSFNHFPGLQILHSTDLVNWELIGAALTDYPGPGWDECIPAEENFAIPQHGCGVWAPAIRYHDGEFYIYCGDPDRGIFMVKTKDPRGRWDDPVWLVRAKGYIDPCPLWDSQGRAWLTHGCAGSRAGLKSVLFIAEMTPDGCSLKEPSRIIYDGHKTQPTIEGTKFYEYQGDYYIFSPAGGVKTGWQTVLRSSDPYGPYQERVVMAQGATDVNGPHQGGWVETQNGEFWFVHFQDKDSYGRIVHLQPMHWKDGWPVIGVDDDGDGVGNPVNSFKRPDLPFSGVKRPYESDEFDGTTLGLQWQWPALPSPYWYYCNAAESRLKLYSVQQPEGWRNLWDTPNLLMQKFPAGDFTATTKISFVPNPQLAPKGENCGLVIMGDSYATLRLTDAADGIKLQLIECVNAHKGAAETVLYEVPVHSEELPVPFSNAYMSTTVPPVKPLEYKECVVYMRTEIRNTPKEGDVPDALCTFSYSLDGENWHKIQVDGNEYEFKARPGRWIGAKVGLYCNRHHPKNDSGWMEADWFRISRQNLK